MAKPELGTKRVCVSCGARFYDLTKSPAICPKCGTEQPLDQPRTRRPSGNLPAEDRRPKKAVPEADDQETDADVADDESEDDDVIEDTSDLEDDNDGIGTDIEVESDNDDNEH
jgi:uncharacterized protein (TIGR02300 family)